MATIPAQNRHAFQTDDAQLQPIADKVFARERLTFEDAVMLYRSPIFSLWAGWPITFASACTAT